MLKPGTGALPVCLAPNARARGGRKYPMCVDKVWEAWADALMNKKPFKATGIGIAYMLAGDTGR